MCMDISNREIELENGTVYQILQINIPNEDVGREKIHPSAINVFKREREKKQQQMSLCF